MIKINKFEHIYGIKKLINANLIDKNTIIYAPNGVMKTSFADGIKDISDGIKPKDIFENPQIEAEFEIEDNGIVIKDSDDEFRLETIIYNATESNEILTNENIASLVMSETLKKKYAKTLKLFNNIRTEFNEIVSKEIFERKKMVEDDIFELGELYNKNDILDILEAIQIDKEYDKYYLNVEYIKLFNNKTDNVYKNEDFIKKCKIYKRYVNVKLDEQVYNSGFTFDSLIEISKELNDTNYFNAGHKIHLSNMQEMGADELERYIKDTIEKVYQNDEVRTKFNDIERILNKNKNTREIIEIIKKDNRFIEEIENLEEYKKKVVECKLSLYKETIDKLQSDAINCKKELTLLEQDALQERGTWKNILDKYNNRFIENKLEVSIENLKDAVLGINTPVFVKRVKGYQTEITDEVFNRFSSGERRAIMILNLMYEVELKKNKTFCLILDDISDSFDYKNKHAIIECLKDFSNEDNIQLIVLTHNFDFYRSLRICMKDKLNSKLLAYSNSGEVTLFNAKQKHFENYSYYANWKNSKRDKDVIATLPFLRNIIQLENNGQDEEYIKITNFLHYDYNLENKKIEEIDFILNKYKIKHDCNDSIYLDLLDKEAREIMRNASIDETKLEEKIVLALYIRIYTDKLMYQEYERIYGKKYIDDGEYNKSGNLFNEISNNINNNVKNILETSLTIAPPFIHVNSFMFEPLIDVGTAKMSQIANEIYNIFH